MKTWNVELKHNASRYIWITNILLKAHTVVDAKAKANAFLNNQYHYDEHNHEWFKADEIVTINAISKTTKKDFGNIQYKKCFQAFRLDEKGRIVK